MSQKIGFAVEAQVRAYLTKKGLHWLISNYRCRWGEIDLIMCDKNYLVFVEVRARMSADFGNAMESITYQKRQRIIKTALHYITTNQLYANYPLRFDVVSIQGSDSQFQWILNAFESGY
jgi:putative endonuclease